MIALAVDLRVALFCGALAVPLALAAVGAEPEDPYDRLLRAPPVHPGLWLALHPEALPLTAAERDATMAHLDGFAVELDATVLKAGGIGADRVLTLEPTGDWLPRHAFTLATSHGPFESFHPGGCVRVRGFPTSSTELSGIVLGSCGVQAADSAAGAASRTSAR